MIETVTFVFCLFLLRGKVFSIFILIIVLKFPNIALIAPLEVFILCIELHETPLSGPLNKYFCQYDPVKSVMKF